MRPAVTAMVQSIFFLSHDVVRVRVLCSSGLGADHGVKAILPGDTFKAQGTGELKLSGALIHSVPGRGEPYLQQ